MPTLFALTLLLSSALVFLIEPMFAKMVLPRLGGTPAVWNTSLVFYQAVLLAGYAYAHLAPRFLGPRRHVYFHLVLVALPLLFLPPRLPPDAVPTDEQHPVVWLLGLLASTAGVPFFVLSTTAPLLQRWFSRLGDRTSDDPYYLYAASNLGSLAALAAYPFCYEPLLTLSAQSKVWSVGYLVLAALIVVCGLAVLRRTSSARDHHAVSKGSDTCKGPPSRARRLRWIALAFVPSGLLVSVTNYLTTDIAAIPLLWVIPLATYLLTFTLVFARREWVSHRILMRVLPLLVLLLTLAMLAATTEPLWILLPLHLGVFFVIGMVCHGELAKDRPGIDYLTSYYLWMSFGGVLGGVFCGLAAPLLFSGLAEYPLLVVAACLLRPVLPFGDSPGEQTPENPDRIVTMDLSYPVGLALLTIGLVVGMQHFGMEHGSASVGLMFGLPAIICYTFLHRPIRFGLGIGALFLGGIFYQGVYGGTLERARSFFGVHQVTLDSTGTFHQLVHGNTIHGKQSLLPENRGEPLAYYARTGPIGQVFQALAAQGPPGPIGVVGLGAGSLAAYARPGQEFTYFEIDPVVERLARDPRYFSFLEKAASKIRIVQGDARLTLRAGPDDHYQLLVIDAFSSDAIPLHLLTREALALYRAKLAPHGRLAFNVSNRYLDLEPVLADLGREMGFAVFARKDFKLTELELKAGKTPSEWVVLVRDKADLGMLLEDPHWRVLRGNPQRWLWTDDYSNLFSVFRW